MITIYGLTDPRTGQIRYVGKSIMPQIRYRNHIKASRLASADTHKNCWIRGLQLIGLKPGLATLQECSPDRADAAEQWWIAALPNLVNSNDGGLGGLHPRTGVRVGRKPGYQHTEEWRQRMSALMKSRGQRPPDPARLTDETRRKIGEGNRRWRAQASPEWLTANRAMYAAKASAQWSDPEIRQRMRAALVVGQQRRIAELRQNVWGRY